jgi:hypothetical protein
MASKSNRRKKKRKKKPAPNISEKIAPHPFKDDQNLDTDKVFIECPGATIYEPGTRNIIAGVRFHDDNDPSQGYDIVANPVYAPEHRKRRLVKKGDVDSIRRCQACQDLTIRMVRREGPDFFIPNPKFPRKRQLKPVDRTW